MIAWSSCILLLFIKESNSLWCFQCSGFGGAGKECPRSQDKIQEWKLNPSKFDNKGSGERSCVLGYDGSNLGYYQVNRNFFVNTPKYIKLTEQTEMCI